METQKGQFLFPWLDREMRSVSLVSAWPNPSQTTDCTCTARVNQSFISGASPGSSVEAVIHLYMEKLLSNAKNCKPNFMLF